MMTIHTFLVLLSSGAFFIYGISYFVTPHMKEEFKRFGLEKLGLMTIVLEFAGAAGLLVGLLFNPLLIFSSLGLALLMFAAVVVRVQRRDSLWISLPALFFMFLNAYICWAAV
ncbi:MAG: DoxX family protein [Sphingobacteriaceae bacterium]|nr:DoxX family protein [Sphingobacteriaceae bacterium]